MSEEPIPYDAYFVEPDGACLAPMAAMLLAKYSEGRYRAASGGVRPAMEADPRAVAALVRLGGTETPVPSPKLGVRAMLAVKTVVSVTGCRVTELLPVGYAGGMIEWRLPDPKGTDADRFGKLVRQLEDKGRQLIRDFDRAKRNFSAM